MTIWRMRIVCWIPKTTDTNSEYVILIDFPLQQWLGKRAPTLRSTYIACIVGTAAAFSSSIILQTAAVFRFSHKQKQICGILIARVVDVDVNVDVDMNVNVGVDVNVDVGVNVNVGVNVDVHVDMDVDVGVN